jgi:hypothetical protein
MKTWLWDILRGSLLVVFFISTLLLSASSERVFVSPDENAAFLFAKQFAETGTFAIIEPLNARLEGIIHARSMVAVGTSILPGAFLGIPFFTGSLLWIFGDAGALLFTPVLALLAILAWRKVVKELFDDPLLADFSAFFLMAHPAFLYYSGRVMMQNVVFVSFLIFGAYFLIASPLHTLSKRYASELKRFEYLLGGMLMGMALFIRTAEIFWVLGLLAVLLYVYRAQIGWRNIGAVLFGLFMMGCVIGYANDTVYGNALLTGYTARAEVGETASSVTSLIPPSVSDIASYVFPFGIHPRAIMRNEWQYEFLLYPWMTIPALIGFVLLLVRKFNKNKTWKVFTIFSVVLAFWLGGMYGSWTFNDNPDPALISIGNSYARYWLPIFVTSTVFAAYAVVAVYRVIKRWAVGVDVSVDPRVGTRERIRRSIPCFFIFLALASTIYLSADLVLYGHDGIMPTRAALSTFQSKRRAVILKTEGDAVIVVDRADKYLFPARKVVVPLRSEATYAALPGILREAPLYYFGITFPQSDLDHLNNVRLAENGLVITLVATFDNESLYKITKK